MVTLTSIASEAFDAVATEVDGVIKSLEFSRSVKGEYNTETGTHDVTPLEYTGRGLSETESVSMSREFPSYVFTGKETMWFVAELDESPKNSDKMSADNKEYTIVAVRDILGTGELYRLLMI